MADVRALAPVVALLVGACATVRDAPPPQIAITIDDLPVHGPFPPGVTANDVNAQMVDAIRSADVPGIFAFVNGERTQSQPETRPSLGGWRSVGVVLANHGWAHRHLNEMSVAEFESELVANENLLAGLGSGTNWRWFRYPFLDEGETPDKRAAARAVLAKHGYRVAAVTMDFSDWQWTAPYARCMAAKDKAAVAELERMYLDSAREHVDASREVARKLHGRDIPYVQLMHVSAMSARMMPRLLQLYRDMGFRFVSLPQAQRDPAYRAYTDLSHPAPPSVWELAAQKGVRLPQPRDYSAKLAAMCAGSGPAVPTQ